MADFYKILKADPLGEPWTPKAAGAKPIQNYWCQVEGQEWAVSVGKQVGNELRPGMHIYGDLKYAKSQKGTEYWKFDSQKVPDDVQRPQDDPSSAAQSTAQAATKPAHADLTQEMPGWFVPVYNMIEYVYKEMKKMDADAPQEEVTPPAPAPEPSKGVEVLAGEVDEETQKTLDNIFGEPPEVPEDK